jgi:hypothetical protein
MERGIGLPLILEVNPLNLFLPKKADAPRLKCAAIYTLSQIYLHPITTLTANSSEDSPKTLVERWCIHYCPSVTGIALPLSPGGLSRSQMSRLDPKHVYKRLMLLIRSVYSYCRILPAYEMYRTSKAYLSPSFILKYKLHSTLPQRGDTASSTMQRFEFSPIETADAKLQLSVEYQPAGKIKILQNQDQLRPPRSRLITNYVQENTQGIPINTGLCRAKKEESVLKPVSSAPAVLLSGGGSTPRRGWSSSFKLSPASKISETPLYSTRNHLCSDPSSSPSQINRVPPAPVDSEIEQQPPPQQEDLSANKVANHPSSSPMAIPRAAQYNKRTHGFRSSGDLGALEGRKAGGGGEGSGALARDEAITQRAYTPDKPMSAPAVSYMHQISPAPRANEFTSPSSSSYPVPSSPYLPFAFTPSARYSTSPASVSSSSGVGNRLFQSFSQPSPPSPHNNNLSGREIPAALKRRPSWGTRSVRGPSCATAAAVAGMPQVGYSISPIRDTMLESVVLSTASTPKILLGYTLPQKGVSATVSDVILTSTTTTTTGVGEFGASSSKKDPLLLTFPSISPAGGTTPGRSVETRGATALVGARLPREDSEVLPFDFSAENYEEHSHHSNNNIIDNNNSDSGQNSIEKTKNSVGEGRTAGDGEEATNFNIHSSTASIGAFMRLINEAQPLSGLAPIPLEVGLHQLEALKSKISAQR